MRRHGSKRALSDDETESSGPRAKERQNGKSTSIIKRKEVAEPTANVVFLTAP
ncbi:hypothetical protein Vi05172_g4111 [Venturia inaequalis]|nr:hypothetical protein Vi05172_g4111 [Venturia inaequalis]